MKKYLVVVLENESAKCIAQFDNAPSAWRYIDTRILGKRIPDGYRRRPGARVHAALFRYNTIVRVV